eukprot:jgi/Astpho2/6612/Aster-x1387
MENYRRVEQPKPEQAEVADNEVLVTSSGRMRSYIAYATKLLTDGKDIVVVKGMGKSVAKCVVVGEIVKRRIVNLHQIAEISSIRVTDVWEPLEDGLTRLETTRHVSVLTISLSSQEAQAIAGSVHRRVQPLQHRKVATGTALAVAGDQAEAAAAGAVAEGVDGAGSRVKPQPQLLGR